MSAEGLCLISKTLAPSGDDWTVSVWKTESFLKFVVRCDYREPCPYCTAHGALCLKDVMKLIDRYSMNARMCPEVGGAMWGAGLRPSASASSPPHKHAFQGELFIFHRSEEGLGHAAQPLDGFRDSRLAEDFQSGTGNAPGRCGDTPKRHCSM
jgi:hypothetical protein